MNVHPQKEENNAHAIFRISLEKKNKTCGQQFFTTEFFQLRRSPNRIHRMVGVLNNFIDFVFSSTLSSLPIFTLAPRIYTLYVMCLYYSIAIFFWVNIWFDCKQSSISFDFDHVDQHAFSWNLKRFCRATHGEEKKVASNRINTLTARPL